MSKKFRPHPTEGIHLGFSLVAPVWENEEALRRVREIAGDRMGEVTLAVAVYRSFFLNPAENPTDIRDAFREVRSALNTILRHLGDPESPGRQVVRRGTEPGSKFRHVFFENFSKDSQALMNAIDAIGATEKIARGNREDVERNIFVKTLMNIFQANGGRVTKSDGGPFAMFLRDCFALCGIDVEGKQGPDIKYLIRKIYEKESGGD